jgi:PAS domain S-box-containing protein
MQKADFYDQIQDLVWFSAQIPTELSPTLCQIKFGSKFKKENKSHLFTAIAFTTLHPSKTFVMFEELLNKVSEPICVVSGEGMIRFANQPFNELCFVTSNQIVGEYFDRFIPEIGGEGFTDMITASGWRRQVYLREIFPLTDNLVAYFFENQENAFLLPHLKEVKNIALVAEKTHNAVVITDSLGFIEWVNEGFTKITGFELEEVYGRKPGEVLQGPLTDPKAILNMREKIAQKIPFHEEVLNYSKEGRPYWLRLYIAPVFDEKGNHIKFIAIETDITEEVQKREQLYNLSLVAQYTSELVAITDKSGHLIWANEGFAKVFLAEKDQIKGQHICDLICENTQIKTLLESPQSFKLTVKLQQGAWQLNATWVENEKTELERYVFVLQSLGEI